MKQKLFNNDSKPACAYCKIGKLSPDESEVICPKNGIMPANGGCKKFVYDPLKRKPKVIRPQSYTKDEFSIDVPTLDIFKDTPVNNDGKPKKIASIINFVRTTEHRVPDDSFLFDTLKSELELCEKYAFASTVLFQYDALICEDYIELVRRFEDAQTGLWLEVVQPLAEKSGILWRGSTPWDPEVSVSYLTGYSPDERKKLIDTAFEKYKDIYGMYPAVVGAWMLDACSLAYMKDKYNISAACICKEQYGTDGITFRGGFFNGAYYPCRNNALCPANTKENQIDVPVFRMLGPDSIHQYDSGLGTADYKQAVCTLEPVCEGYGGNREWVENFLNENYNDKCLSFAFAQFGQENSFGWEDISKGLPMQMELLKEKVRTGEIQIMTLDEAGNWYSDTFDETVPEAMCTDNDLTGDGYRSIWYYSKYYRVNIISRDENVWIRDLSIFDENYKEQFLDKANREKRAGQFTLPVMDGLLFSNDSIRAGIYPVGSNTADLLSTALKDEIIATAGNLSYDIFPNKILCKSKSDDWHFEFRTADNDKIPYIGVAEKKLFMSFRGFSDDSFDYSLSLSKGRFEEKAGVISVYPENGEIEFKFDE